MELLERLLDGSLGGITSPELILFTFVLAFVLGQTLAWVYYFTHQSLSYSRSFVQSIVLMTVIVSMVMVAIGGSLITAFGLMGALAMIRFRHMIKDSRDISFVSAALVIGMSVGSQRFQVAIIGTVVICFIVLYLHVTGFGTHQPHNAFLRFTRDDELDEAEGVEQILKKYCGSSVMISVQQNSGVGPAEYAYQLMVKDAGKNHAMVCALEAVPGVANVSLVMQEQLLEI